MCYTAPPAAARLAGAHPHASSAVSICFANSNASNRFLTSPVLFWPLAPLHGKVGLHLQASTKGGLLRAVHDGPLAKPCTEAARPPCACTSTAAQRHSWPSSAGWLLPDARAWTCLGWPSEGATAINSTSTLCIMAHQDPRGSSTSHQGRSPSHLLGHQDLQRLCAFAHLTSLPPSIMRSMHLTASSASRSS
jgi:hypothetical protein